MDRSMRLMSLFFLALASILSSAEEQSCTSENAVSPNEIEDYSKPLPKEYSIMYYPVEYGEAQEIAGPEAPDTRKRIWEMEQYMEKHVLRNETLGDASNNCILYNKLCAYWATLGECESNPKYMTMNCAPVCYTCDNFAFHLRCPFDRKAAELDNIWRPGDLNLMFERIVSHPGLREYAPRALSQPEPPSDAENVKVGPWVVLLENFLTDEECNTLIELGVSQGYEISKDLVGKKLDGTYGRLQHDGHTGRYAWCNGECAEDPTSRRVVSKIETLTRIPEKNAQYLQLLHYEVGQFDSTQHYFSGYEVDRRQGPKILTVFVYLNDVEEGGGTNFPDLGLTIMPKRGRAIVWPSVLDSDPNAKDERTKHQALPVESGVKFAANAWLHLRDLKTPLQENCA